MDTLLFTINRFSGDWLSLHIFRYVINLKLMKGKRLLEQTRFMLCNTVRGVHHLSITHMFKGLCGLSFKPNIEDYSLIVQAIVQIGEVLFVVSSLDAIEHGFSFSFLEALGKVCLF